MGMLKRRGDGVMRSSAEVIPSLSTGVGTRYGVACLGVHPIGGGHTLVGYR